MSSNKFIPSSEITLNEYMRGVTPIEIPANEQFYWLLVIKESSLDLKLLKPHSGEIINISL